MKIIGGRFLIAGSAIVMLVLLSVGLVEAWPGAPPRPAAPSDPAAPARDLTTDSADVDAADPWGILSDERLDHRGWLDHRGRWGGRFKHLGHLDRLHRLVHAEAVLDLPQQGLTRYTVDVGEVTAVTSDGTVTLERKDGQSVSVATDQDTKVRKTGQKVEVSALASGDQVLAVAVDRDGTLLARVIRVKEPESTD
jgi:hypothetical protein